MRILQNQIIEEGDQDILEKMEKWEKSIKGWGVGVGGGETSIDGKGVSTDAFSLTMYGFCRNHALYPAILSFIFLSVPFNK